MDPPYGKWTPSIPTLIMLHITLILLRIMYIAFPNLKHCKNKCLSVSPFFLGGGGPYSTIEYGPGSIEKLLYEVWTWYINLSWIIC